MSQRSKKASIKLIIKLLTNAPHKCIKNIQYHEEETYFQLYLSTCAFASSACFLTIN